MTRDLAGQRFGKLVAVRPIGRKNRYVLWECACDCGNTAEVMTDLLTSGKVKSCGCMPTGRRRTVHKGKRFGRLTAVDPVGEGGRDAAKLWRCVCTCGNERNVSEGDLLAGVVTSCGCAQEASASAHGSTADRGSSSAVPSAARPARKPRAQDVSGQRFGELTALEPTDRRESGSVVWHCRCSCGREADVSLTNLKRRKHPTCGPDHNTEHNASS